MLIPLKVDVPMSRLPIVNYVLMAVIIGVSLIAFSNESLCDKWCGADGEIEIGGIAPEKLEKMSEHQLEAAYLSGKLTITQKVNTESIPLVVLAVTNTFLHADWLHLIGNMLFLWIFGNAVNYKLGHPLYILVYLLCGLAGSMAHYAFVGGPVLGASGAINGMMGAFLVFFPLNDVKIFYWFRFRAGTFDLAGIWVVLLYVAWDVLLLVIGQQTSTALWAHVAGFAVGFAAALMLLLTNVVRPTVDERSIAGLFGRE